MAANLPVIPVSVAPAAVVFALKNIVNLSSKLGRDIYNKTTTAITIPFDGSSKNTNLIQSQLLRKAENTG